MTSSVVRQGPAIATIGAVFELGDNWRCQCGLEHKFGAYMAAHWDDEMTHTCKCGASRTFLSGEVIE